MTKVGFGIDIGGSGIKGARVNLEDGTLASERIKILTPRPATPEKVAAVIQQLLDEAGWSGPVGCTFPGIVRHGILYSAANLGGHWVGTDFAGMLRDITGHASAVLNDADAAGLAENRFGAARDVPGVVIVTTLGTGIGSAILIDGKLVPNTELGHLEMNGQIAEKQASSAVKEREGLKWGEWSKRLQQYYSMVEFLFSPDLLVVGGGISRKSAKFLPLLDLKTPIVPAQLRNEAGIVGAAMAAAEQFGAREEDVSTAVVRGEEPDPVPDEE